MRERWPGATVRMLHLGALYALAVSQPLLGVLGRNAEFFTARQSSAGDIWVFAFLVAIVPPLVAGAVEALVERVSRRAALVLHVALVALLAALIAEQALKRGFDPTAGALLAAAVVLGLAGAALYLRSSTLRSVATWFAPLPLLVLVFFLVATPVRKLVFSTTPAAASVQANDTPVVMVVFDEFTGTTILGRHDRIDPVLFPNFAKLVRGGGVYYRNYTAAADETTRVVSALLTGDKWHEHVLPIAAEYPHNLFTLLGGSDRLVVSEEASDLCPQNLCHEENERGSRRHRQHGLLADAGLVYLHRIAPTSLERDLTPVNETLGEYGDEDAHRKDPRQQHSSGIVLRELGGGGRPARFVQWLRRIDGRGSTVYFKHVLLPHVPWQYLPDGRVYREHPQEYIPGINAPPSFDDPWLLAQAYQRHILQASFADRLIGQLLARLKRTGLYERSLIVITADNGEAFLHAGHDRHVADSETFTDIADTPLFIKLPGRRHGGYDDRHVRTVDVVPTIADAVGVRMPWHVEGRSILRRGAPGPVIVYREQYTNGPVFSTPLRAYERARRAALRRKLALFGHGIWRVGPHSELIGSPVASLRVSRSPATGAITPEVADLLSHVDLSSNFLPANVTGQVTSGGRRGLPLALALNGRIAAVGETAMLKGDSRVYFSFMVAPRFFRNGANSAQVFLVTGRHRVEQIASTG